MTELSAEPTSPSDAELIARVRGGDVDAYGALFDRHQAAAHRLARQLVRGSDTDDLVSEAFAKVLQILQGGGGPDVAFRAYLLTAIRRLHVDRIRGTQRLHYSDDMEVFDPGVPFQDTAVEGFERRTTSQAFASLPERWQLVLWHLEVEGQKPAEIAPLLGMSANSVSALAYRAREGLRQAYLQMHLADTVDETCRWTNEHLGAYVRQGLSKRDGAKVERHLDECRRCAAVYLELVEVNSNLRGVLAPLLLGAAATGYLALGAAGGVLGSGAAGVLQRAGQGLQNAGQTVAAVGVAGAVAAGTLVGAAAMSGDDDRVVPRADGPVAVAPSDPGGDTGQQPPAEPPDERSAPPSQPREEQPDRPSQQPQREANDSADTGSDSGGSSRSEPPAEDDEPADEEDGQQQDGRDNEDDSGNGQQDPGQDKPERPEEPEDPGKPEEPEDPETFDVGVALDIRPAKPTPARLSARGAPSRALGSAGLPADGTRSQAVASWKPHSYHGTVSFTGTEKIEELRATLTLPDRAGLYGHVREVGWECRPISDYRQQVCEGSGSEVGEIEFLMSVSGPRKDVSMTAEVEITSEEQDTNPANDTATWSPPATGPS